MFLIFSKKAREGFTVSFRENLDQFRRDTSAGVFILLQI